MKLYGKNSVLERIRFNPSTIKKIYLQKRTDLSEIVKAIQKNNLSFKSLEKKEFSTISKGFHAQGVVAEVAEYVYYDFDDLLQDAIESQSCILYLDSLTDPQNLGAIIRTSACFGNVSMILPTHNSVSVNETVLKVASGGENYCKIAQVKSTSHTMRRLKEERIDIYGTCVEEGQSITTTTFDYPLCMVIGSEGKGIRPGVAKYLEQKVYVPMPGATLSFNASIVTALFLYEVTKQRDPKK